MSYHATCHHSTYRLTCADYEELWAYAKGRCEICRCRPEDTPDGKLFIDHAGEYDEYAVRGLLCSKCNSLMGYVDRGQKKDSRALRYRRDAWFVRILRQRHKANVAAAAEARRLVAHE